MTKSKIVVTAHRVGDHFHAPNSIAYSLQELLNPTATP